MWLEKASEIAIENFKKELEEKASFIKQVCTDDFPEEIAMALFEIGVSLKELERIHTSYSDNSRECIKFCDALDKTYLEKKIMEISSPNFDMNSTGWNHNCTKEQQRATAVNDLGYVMLLTDLLEDENIYGVIQIPISTVRTLTKKVAKDFDEKALFEVLADRVEKVSKVDESELEEIRYEAILLKYKENAAQLTAWNDIQKKAIALALLKNEVKMGVVSSFISDLEYDDYGMMKMSKNLFLMICKLSL